MKKVFFLFFVFTATPNFGMRKYVCNFRIDKCAGNKKQTFHILEMLPQKNIDIDIVHKLIKGRADVNAECTIFAKKKNMTDMFGDLSGAKKTKSTILQVALEFDHLDVALALIAAGARTNNLPWRLRDKLEPSPPHPQIVHANYNEDDTLNYIPLVPYPDDVKDTVEDFFDLPPVDPADESE